MHRTTGQSSPHCPRTGLPLDEGFRLSGRKWLFPVAGLAALVWFLVRVVPKPSRATYPCQRIAAPLAAGFVSWLGSLVLSLGAWHRARTNWRRSRYILAGLLLLVALLGLGWSSLGTWPGGALAAQHTDPPNSPVGVARGIFPGRVAWVYDPSAAVWDGSSGFWWDDANTSQAAVDRMLSRSIRTLAGTATDAAAWEAVFRYFNRTHGRGDVGYAAGETIAIKINMNNSCAPWWWAGGYADDNSIDASPQTVLALVRQLVNGAGVAPAAITLYDASRCVTDPIYNRVLAEFPGVVAVDSVGTDGRVLVQWVDNAIHYSVPNTNGAGLPTVVVQADYLINMALLKLHGGGGVTLLGKNHVGSISSISHAYFDPDRTPRPIYNTFVDFMAHRDLGEKTVLFVIDGLYGQDGAGGVPYVRWSGTPFNDRWPSSLFVSQDQVALDSVGYDFLSAQWPDYADLSYGDAYLHEAALADNPPSGTFYDPEEDGVRATSLGAHEHWNNSVDRQYSRNLGAGAGIELVLVDLSPNLWLGASDPAPAPGQVLTYTIVCYSGVQVSDGVISDTLPAGLSFIGPVTLVGGSGTAGAPPALVSGLSFPAGGTVTATFAVSVTAGAGAVLTNRATLDATGLDSRLAGQVTVIVGGNKLYLPLLGR